MYVCDALYVHYSFLYPLNAFAYLPLPNFSPGASAPL